MIHEGDIKGVKKFICEGNDTEALDEFGQNCLHLACSGNQVSVAALLISQGANVNAMESRGETLDWMTPIHIAVLGNSIELVQMLISAGADVNIKTGGPSGGYTCLHLVRSSKMANILINAGANINAREDMEGTTPLMHALEISMVDVAHTLVNAGADVNISRKDGTTLLESVRDSPKCDQWVSRVSSMLIQAGAS